MTCFMLTRENFLRLLIRMRQAQRDYQKRPTDENRIRAWNLEMMIDDELMQLDQRFDLGL